MTAAQQGTIQFGKQNAGDPETFDDLCREVRRRVELLFALTDRFPATIDQRKWLDEWAGDVDAVTDDLCSDLEDDEAETSQPPDSEK